MLRKIWKLIVALFVGVVGIIKIAIQAILPIWQALKDGGILFAIFYQPFLVSITFAVLLRQIESAITDEDVRILLIIVIGFETLLFTFIENAVIELVYHLRNKTENYITLQKVQQYFNNYALLFISLAALFSAAFPSNDGVLNQGLFAFGTLYFLTTIYSDAYRVFIFEKETIKELAVQLKEIWEDN